MTPGGCRGTPGATGVRNMRSLILASFLITFSACSGASDSDNDNALDSNGKADGASSPSGAYTNPTPHYGELSTMSLNADHSFTRSEIVACAGGGTCPPLAQKGTYLLTHSSTKHYIHFYAEDGSSLDRYEWKFVSSKLELNYDGDDHWFDMDSGSTCAAAGGTCVPLVPDACAIGSIGDANQYSCGGGLGVECCLPPQAPACQAASDCGGVLPQFCRLCSDGTSSCAHWSCVNNACEIATCQ
jgi:hypothetical protein